MSRHYQRTKLLPWYDSLRLEGCYHAHIHEISPTCYNPERFSKPYAAYLLESDIFNNGNYEKYKHLVQNSDNPTIMYIIKSMKVDITRSDITRFSSSNYGLHDINVLGMHYKELIYANPLMPYYKSDSLNTDLTTKSKEKRDMLSLNPGVVDILRKQLQYVSWKQLSLNEAAIDILEANTGEIHLYELCKNKGAENLIKKLIRKKQISKKLPHYMINSFLKNPCFIRILERYFWLKFTTDIFYFGYLLSSDSICY